MSALVEFDQFVGLSFFLLALLAADSFINPRSLPWRFAQLIAQTIVTSLASALGAHHFYYLILYVIGGKAAVLLPRAQMVAVGVLLAVSHVLSGQFAFFALHNLHIRRHPEPLYYRSFVVEFQSIIYFVISMATVVFLGRMFSAERKSLSKERVLQEEVEGLAVRVERARIARDIHDGLGHTLTSLRIQLELALKLLEEENCAKVKELLTNCQESASASLQEVRRAVRTEKDGEFILKKAVCDLVEQIKLQAPLKITVSLDDRDLSPTLQYQIFSIIKECLTNIRKHSSADCVEISLVRHDDRADLRILDNGKGFSVEALHSGFGLKGLRERADAIAASLSIESNEGKGTDISLSFPVFSGKASGTIRAF